MHAPLGLGIVQTHSPLHPMGGGGNCGGAPGPGTLFPSMPQQPAAAFAGAFVSQGGGGGLLMPDPGSIWGASAAGSGRQQQY